MPQPIDVHLWPIFATIQEELEGLLRLIIEERNRLNAESERIMNRIHDLERRHAKYGGGPT